MKRKKGIMLSEVAFRNIPILLKNCGMDFFIIDTEHGGFDYSDLDDGEALRSGKYRSSAR